MKAVFLLMLLLAGALATIDVDPSSSEEVLPTGTDTEEVLTSSEELPGSDEEDKRDVSDEDTSEEIDVDSDEEDNNSDEPDKRGIGLNDALPKKWAIGLKKSMSTPWSAIRFYYSICTLQKHFVRCKKNTALIGFMLRVRTVYYKKPFPMNKPYLKKLPIGVRVPPYYHYLIRYHYRCRYIKYPKVITRFTKVTNKFPGNLQVLTWHNVNCYRRPIVSFLLRSFPPKPFFKKPPFKKPPGIKPVWKPKIHYMYTCAVLKKPLMKCTYKYTYWQFSLNHHLSYLLPHRVRCYAWRNSFVTRFKLQRVGIMYRYMYQCCY